MPRQHRSTGELGQGGASSEDHTGATAEYHSQVTPSTVEQWRTEALGGITESLRRGTSKSPRELELEREVATLQKVVTKTSIQKCLLEQALETERAKRPTVPGKSRR